MGDLQIFQRVLQVAFLEAFVRYLFRSGEALRA